MTSTYAVLSLCCRRVTVVKGVVKWRNRLRTNLRHTRGWLLTVVTVTPYIRHMDTTATPQQNDTQFGIATLRPGKYEVAVGNAKIGTVVGYYATGFRSVLIDGTVLRLLYDTPHDAAEALAAHLEFVIDAEIESWVAQCREAS